MPGTLQGKVAVVTGFGRGIAEKFRREGAEVIIADFSERAGLTTAAALRAEVVKADVTSRQSWQDIVQLAEDKFGRLDLVINNAGTTERNKPTNEVADEDFDGCFSVDVKAIYYPADGIVPCMQKTGDGGSCVSIASTAGIRPRPGLAWYNASKAAVLNATKTMAVGFAKDQIRFHSICPVVGLGTGPSDLFLGDAENEKVFMATVALGRGCSPADVGNAAAFLCGEEAAFLTGIDLPVDGGRCVARSRKARRIVDRGTMAPRAQRVLHLVASRKKGAATKSDLRFQ